MGIDELFEQMRMDELSDATTLTPIEYARMRGIYPQRVYRAIRNHQLECQRCTCNRRVVVVSEADELFNKRVKPDVGNDRVDEDAPAGDVPVEDKE